MLLSAAPAPVTALFADAKLIAADVKAVQRADAAGLKAITADIHQAKLTKTDAAALRTLNSTNAGDLHAVAIAIRAVNLAVSTDTKKLFATESALAKKPTSLKLLAQALSLSTKLSADAATALSLLDTINTKLVTDIDAHSSALGGVISTTNLIVDGGFEAPNVGTGINGETDLGATGSGIYEFYASGTQPQIPLQAPNIDQAWQVPSGSVEILGNDPSKLSPQSSTGYFQWVPPEGVQSLDLDGVSPGTIYQDIPTVVGLQYTLTFMLAGNPAQSAIKTVGVTAGAVTQQFTFDVTGKSVVNMGWTSHSMAFTATGTTTRIQFASLDDSTSSAGPALDAISVVAAPTTSQGKLTTTVTSYQTNLTAAIQKLTADTTTALTTDVATLLAVYG